MSEIFNRGDAGLPVGRDAKEAQRIKGIVGYFFSSRTYRKTFEKSMAFSSIRYTHTNISKVNNRYELCTRKGCAPANQGSRAIINKETPKGPAKIFNVLKRKLNRVRIPEYKMPIS